MNEHPIYLAPLSPGTCLPSSIGHYAEPSVAFRVCVQLFTSPKCAFCTCYESEGGREHHPFSSRRLYPLYCQSVSRSESKLDMRGAFWDVPNNFPTIQCEVTLNNRLEYRFGTSVVSDLHMMAGYYCAGIEFLEQMHRPMYDLGAT
jgi:hypothetical protein